MKNLTLSLLCAGLITTTAIAEDICNGAFQAQNYQQSAACYVEQLKNEQTFHNLEMAGISYVNQGRYKEALPYLKEAEKKAITSSDYAMIYSWLSTTYGQIGNTIQELAYDMKVLDLSLKSEDRENIGAAYNNLGKYYDGQKQHKKALEYYEKALENKEESERAQTYGNMAVAYDNLNDPKHAEEMYLKAIEIDQQTGEYKSLGYQKSNLGIFYFTHNRYDEALTTLQESQNISHNAGDIATESFALSYLATIDYQNGQINQAKTKATDALHLAKQSGESVIINKANKTWNLINGKK